MVLTVNGERAEVSSTTVTALLQELGHDASFIAVAVNQHVVRRRDWPATALAEGDSVEILTPRQGG